MKKLLTALLCCITALATLGTFTACTLPDSNDSSGGSVTPNTREPIACVNIDINPSIELIVDKNSTVISIRGANDDGVLLLYGEQTLVGKSLNEALEIIIDYAVKYGFLSEENPVISAISNADNAELLATVTQAINTSITAASTATGLSLSVDLNGAFSLYRRLSELKARFPESQSIQALTVNKLSLAVSVSETTGISLEAAIELDESRLLELISTADQKIENYATNEFNAAKREALAIYDKISAIEIYAAYAEVYANHVTDRLLTSYYGAAYQLYASAATGFSALLDVNDVMAQVVNYELDAEKVEEIAAIFGLTDVEPLRSANGVITIKSIEAYADKTFRNLAGDVASAEILTQKKQALTEALNLAESAIRAEIDKLADEYVSRISSQLEQAQAVYNQVKPVLSQIKEALEIMVLVPGLKESVDDISAITADFEEITAKLQEFLNGKTLAVSEFEKLVSEYAEKAAKYLEKINADLTDEERAELNSKLEAIALKHAKEKAELDAALEDAKNQAIDFLTSTKNKLKEQLSVSSTDDDTQNGDSTDGSNPDGTNEIVPPDDNDDMKDDSNDGSNAKNGDSNDDDKLIDAEKIDPNDVTDNKNDDFFPIIKDGKAY